VEYGPRLGTLAFAAAVNALHVRLAARWAVMVNVMVARAVANHALTLAPTCRVVKRSIASGGRNSTSRRAAVGQVATSHSARYRGASAWPAMDPT